MRGIMFNGRVGSVRAAASLPTFRAGIPNAVDEGSVARATTARI